MERRSGKAGNGCAEHTFGWRMQNLNNKNPEIAWFALLSAEGLVAVTFDREEILKKFEDQRSLLITATPLKGRVESVVKILKSTSDEDNLAGAIMFEEMLGYGVFEIAGMRKGRRYDHDGYTRLVLGAVQAMAAMEA